ncbi:MAG: hypothetical protein HXS42_14305, partial [Theionarchaea archaeon]|nr:hypothetical protein [Theionarchaea archaeon]
FFLATYLGTDFAAEFEEEMRAVMDNPVYKGRFTVTLVYANDHVS